MLDTSNYRTMLNYPQHFLAFRWWYSEFWSDLWWWRMEPMDLDSLSAGGHPEFSSEISPEKLEKDWMPVRPSRVGGAGRCLLSECFSQVFIHSSLCMEICTSCVPIWPHFIVSVSFLKLLQMSLSYNLKHSY